MIESLSIAKCATYGTHPQVANNLKKANYVYGSNGSGKTTLSRVIANTKGYPDCAIFWRNNQSLKSIVFNRDFVEDNFNQTTIKGVFTLGKAKIEELDDIKRQKEELDAKKQKQINLTDGLRRAEDVQNENRARIENQCWKAKEKLEPIFIEAFSGYRHSKKAFCYKSLADWTDNSADVSDLEELEKLAETLYGKAPDVVAVPGTFDASTAVAGMEDDSILSQRLVGSQDIDVAGLIQNLDNSDWVRQGLKYLEQSKPTCPLCQQTVPVPRQKELESYFDASYEANLRKLSDILTSYTSETNAYRDYLQQILVSDNVFINSELLQAHIDTAGAHFELNIKLIKEKLKEPSKAISLEYSSSLFKRIETDIEMIRKQSIKHNSLIQNLEQEKRALTQKVWKYLTAVELKAQLKAFEEESDKNAKAITGISEKLNEVAEEIKAIQSDIATKESNLTSILPTIEAINAILSSYHFKGFKLEEAETGRTYRIVRMDGSDVGATLSEGERSFLTFLYFYHFALGSDTVSGITQDRIVVIDDPVSSMDSEVLFIVGSLVKKLIADVKSDEGQLKQIFILTHNIYFHREVTYDTRRQDTSCLADESFWVVRKVNEQTSIIPYSYNPVRTTYELLWSQIREGRRDETIQNTLRRILENYFRIAGGVNRDILSAKFEGEEQHICRALVSWAHDGSHFAGDEIYMSLDEAMTEKFLDVFKQTFEKMGHAAHYNMMMKLSPEDPGAAALA
jgi:wobble nucleotide-excising tRNase